MSGAEPYLLAAAVGMGAVQSIAQGQQQSAIAKQNAALQQQRADTIRAQGERAEADHRRRLRKHISSQRAQIGAAGIALEGSALLALEESAAEGELDALTIRYQSELGAADAEAEAAARRMEARAFRTNGFMSAASQLLFGGYKLSGHVPSPGGGGGGVSRPPLNYSPSMGL